MIKILSGQYVVDGAGVKIFRVFSHDTVELTDPFLLLDHFGSDDPKDYIKGFPWHPHRGIETVTYMNKGEVEHQDNIGHKGVIGPGDVQWMSAGSGIVHQEMPQGLHGMDGFQLWVNMPSLKKMIDPEYRGIEKKEIKILKKDGVEIKIISGEYNTIRMRRLLMLLRRIIPLYVISSQVMVHLCLYQILNLNKSLRIDLSSLEMLIKFQ